MTDPLSTWNDGAVKTAILGFVERAGRGGLPAEDRVAVFDNDGTLWCEKPMPIQLDFFLRRLVAMAENDPSLRDRQPWKAAHERDYGWLARVLADHYAGDDTNLPVAGGRPVAAYANITVDAVRGGVRRVPAQRPPPHAGPRLPRVRVRTRWSSCSATCGPTASRTTSPPAAVATS